MQKYFIKATLSGGRSGYDHNFIYHEGENIHPNPDRKSKYECGRGIHLAKTLPFALEYVPNATEFYLAIPGDILGEGEDKIRTDRCVLWRIPKSLGDDYRAKCKALDDDLWAKCKPLYDDYRAKCKPLYDDYKAKCKPLDRGFMRTCIKAYKESLRCKKSLSR